MIPFHLELLGSVTADNADLLLLEIVLSELESNRGTLELPIGKFPTWVIIVTVIAGGADTSLFQSLRELICLADYLCRVIVLLDDRNEHCLDLCNARGENETLVVRVDHDHGAN